MAKRLSIAYDSGLIDSISTDFDLRAPNKEALRKLVFALDGDYEIGRASCRERVSSPV